MTQHVRLARERASQPESWASSSETSCGRLRSLVERCEQSAVGPRIRRCLRLLPGNQRVRRARAADGTSRILTGMTRSDPLMRLKAPRFSAAEVAMITHALYVARVFWKPTESVAHALGYDDQASLATEVARVEALLTTAHPMTVRDWSIAEQVFETVSMSTRLGLRGDWGALTGQEDHEALTVLNHMRDEIPHSPTYVDPE